MQSIMAHKCGLHRVEIAVFFQTLDGSDLVVRMHHGERQAAVDALSIDDRRAGAALAVIAAFLAAGEGEMFAQRIEQRGANVKREIVQRAVHAQLKMMRGARIGGSRRGLRCG